MPAPRVKTQIIVECDWVDAGIDIAGCEQGGEGRGKAEASTFVRIIKRLDAETVAREHHAPAFAFCNRESEHALEALDAARPPGVVTFQNDFGVAVREEAITFALEFASQLAEIVDAAVERDCESEFAIDHRLVGRGTQIENAQTPVAERNIALRIHAACIRPTMSEIACYGLGDSRTRSVAAASYFTADSTHNVRQQYYSLMRHERDPNKKSPCRLPDIVLSYGENLCALRRFNKLARE